MPDFESALNRIRERSQAQLESSRDLLRDLIGDACAAISAKEGSILIPTTERTSLRFLASINPTLDTSDFTFPVDKSFSGFVFNSGRAIAKVKPESEVISEISDITKVNTEFFLAVPIVDDDRIHGVATFVNRTGEFTETPFSADDIHTAESFGEIYATGLRFHQQIGLSAELARHEADENACELGVSQSEENGDINHDIRLTSRIIDTTTNLPPRERALLLDIAGLIREHSRSELDDENDEF